MSTRSRDPRYPRRIVVLGAAIACWLALGVVSAAALSSTDQQLLSSPNLEIRPSANDTMLAWSENSHAHPRFFNVFVRPLAGGQVKRLNADDTRGYNGGFDGSELIFQQISKTGQSDLVIYDTATKQYVPVPGGVNTPRWEATPTMSGDFILFSRETGRRSGFVDRLILHRISNGHEEVLASLFSDYRRGPFIDAGQVNGDFATWDVCSRANGCNVFRHQISTDHTIRIPDRQQEYAPSVASDGTVFFIRSGVGCGTQARLMRYANGAAVVADDFARNRDSFDTFALDANRVVRDAVNCRTGDINVNLTTVS